MGVIILYDELRISECSAIRRVDRSKPLAGVNVEAGNTVSGIAA